MTSKSNNKTGKDLFPDFEKPQSILRLLVILVITIIGLIILFIYTVLNHNFLDWWQANNFHILINWG